MYRGVIIALIPLLAACAPGPTGQWIRPTGDGAAAYSRDTATCRSEAKRRAEREFALDTQHLDRGRDGVFGRQSIETDIARRDAMRFQQSIYEDCLRGLGYVPRQSGGKPESPLEAR